MAKRLTAAGVRESQRIKDFFDSRAEQWDQNLYCDVEIMRRIMEACDLKAGQRVLDAACGTGVLFPRLLAHDPTALVGVDISGAMAETARRKHCDHRLEIVTSDLLRFDAGKFDRIILYNAYPHFFDKPLLARKLYDLSAAGGRFVIAHGAGREQINSMHEACGAGDISVALQRAGDEAKWFAPYFNIDVCMDTDEIYIISGTKADTDV